VSGWLKPCGTVAAYRRHFRNGETPCEACRAAENARQVARYRKRHPDAKPRPDELQPCGTAAAYGRHVHAGEATCEPCRKAWREYCKAQRDEKRRRRG
jgi:hypothetical protein